MPKNIIIAFLICKNEQLLCSWIFSDIIHIMSNLIKNSVVAQRNETGASNHHHQSDSSAGGAAPARRSWNNTFMLIMPSYLLSPFNDGGAWPLIFITPVKQMTSYPAPVVFIFFNNKSEWSAGHAGKPSLCQVQGRGESNNEGGRLVFPSIGEIGVTV